MPQRRRRHLIWASASLLSGGVKGARFALFTHFVPSYHRCRCSEHDFRFSAGTFLCLLLAFATCIVCPVCIGSGVPGIMSYLNGVHMHNLLSTFAGFWKVRFFFGGWVVGTYLASRAACELAPLYLGLAHRSSERSSLFRPGCRLGRRVRSCTSVPVLHRSSRGRCACRVAPCACGCIHSLSRFRLAVLGYKWRYVEQRVVGTGELAGDVSGELAGDVC